MSSTSPISPGQVSDAREINKKIASGAAWMVSFKLIDRAMGLACTVVLARLLLPSDFGLVALATAIIAAIELLGAFSFDVSLIQNPGARRAHFDTAWTLNVLVALCGGAGLAMLAYPAAIFFNEPRLHAIMYVLAAGTALQGFENIGTVAFRRDLQFHREFKFLFGKRMASVIVTIPLAVMLQSYWALVLGQVSGKIISVALSYYVSPYRPRLSLAAKGHLFHFSKWMMATHSIVFLHSRLADFMIGKLAGAEALGIYTISYEVSNLPTTELVGPINRAAFPAYSRLSDEPERLRESFLRVIAMIALFALPSGVGIALLADLFVPAVLGWQWEPATPLIRVLALCGVIIAVQSNMTAVYLAVGRPRIITAISAVQLVVLASMLIPAILYYGSIGAAWATMATAILITPVNQFLIARQLGISVRQFASELLRPIVASVAMAATVYQLKEHLSLPHETTVYVAALLLCIFVGAASYGAAIWVLWRLAGCPNGPESACIAQARQALHRNTAGTS